VKPRIVRIGDRLINLDQLMYSQSMVVRNGNGVVIDSFMRLFFVNGRTLDLHDSAEVERLMNICVNV
jgi:hypothetical protein